MKETHIPPHNSATIFYDQNLNEAKEAYPYAGIQVEETEDHQDLLPYIKSSDHCAIRWPQKRPDTWLLLPSLDAINFHVLLIASLIVGG